MADDISKNIIIQVTAQTDQLEQSITNLNTIINNLLSQQKQLTDAGNQNSIAFQNNADKINIFSKSLQNATMQLNNYLSVLNSSATALQKNQSLITALTSAKDKYSKTVGDNSKKVTELNNAIKTLSSSTQQQQAKTAQSNIALDTNNKSLADNTQQAIGLHDSLGNVSEALKQQKEDLDSSKSSFYAHKKVMDHLKTSFDEIKDVSGEFGPSLQEAAQGFDLMKSGLAVVKDGLTGVGDALKADGFDFLLLILQKIFDAFVNSAEGAKVFQGAISAIGVVVNKVREFFGEFMDGVIKAVTHPIDAIKSLGTMVEQNIINRFTAFGKILDGLVHLDFKKVTDGAIQAVTGITNATGKIAATVHSVTDTIVQTGVEIAKAYEYGFDRADQSMQKFENKSVQFIRRQKSLSDQKQSNRGENSILNPALSSGVSTTTTQSTATIDPYNIPAIQDSANEVTKVNHTMLQQLADAAKQNASQIASDGFKVLTNSIKQQADAKISALESQKDNELSNTNLTSAQKIAIETKFKKQEGQIKAKAFKEEQEASVAQAVINGALAITKGTAQTGVLASLYIPSIIAETAIEIAKIESQKPPAYASGGLHYSSDGRGGVLPGYSRTDNTNAYLRSGEGVVVSEAMRNPWARNLVSAINVGFGGRDFSTGANGRNFAVGGIFTDGGDANRYYNAPVNDQKNLANTIAYQMINNFPPVYVDVKDINNQQNILAQTINRVNL